MSVKLYGGNRYVEVKFWNFPAGERGVRIEESEFVKTCRSVCIELNYESSTDLVDMLLLHNAIKHVDKNVRMWLKIPYFPYARQDRVMVDGESLSLQVATSLVKTCDFFQIEVCDPHSDVLQGVFDPGVLVIKRQHELLYPMFDALKNFALLSPDAGALKKVYKLAEKLGCDVVEAGKVRDVKTGKIVRSKVDDFDVAKYDSLVIVDDIIDGGRTFIELANAVREYGFSGKLKLFATHGIFSQGKKVIEDVFDEVKCFNDMSKEK